MSAAQLHSRGHEVLVVICDGLPYTEREIVDLPKIKSFKRCAARTQRYCNAYGIPFITINSFLSEEEKKYSKELSLGMIKDLLRDLHVAFTQVSEAQNKAAQDLMAQEPGSESV